jgi:hypothetical protein
MTTSGFSPVPVLGMHRSGTSVATRLFGLAGAPLPVATAPGRRSNAANAKGFWEVQPLTDLNEDVLRALDGEWSAPPNLPSGWPADPRLVALRRRQSRLARRYLSEPGVVWKDPRLCLTLPFWADVVPPGAPAVLVLRNVVEIVASLSARDAMTADVGFALWERYMRSALDLAAGRPVLVLTYEDIVRDPVMVVGQIRSWFGDVGLPLGAASDETAIASFVAPELRHARHDDEDVVRHDAITESQRALHRALASLVGAHASLPLPTLALPESSQPLLETRRMQRAPRRRARRRWDRRVRRAVLQRTSLLARRLRNRR